MYRQLVNNVGKSFTLAEYFSGATGHKDGVDFYEVRQKPNQRSRMMIRSIAAVIESISHPELNPVGNADNWAGYDKQSDLRYKRGAYHGFAGSRIHIFRNYTMWDNKLYPDLGEKINDFTNK